MKNLILLVSLTLFSASATAHDVWVVANDADNSYQLVYGHPGEPEDYDPAKVEGVSALDKNGIPRDVSSSVLDGKVVIKTGPEIALIAIDFNNGFWTEGPDKKHANRPKWEIGDYKASSHSKKFNKNILAWSSAISKPLGTELEIVPLTDPLKLQAGNKLPVQVLYRSRPLAGVEVQVMGDKEAYTTDANGRASIPVQQAEFQYIAVGHRVESRSNPNADVLSLSANLVIVR